jgi:trehalose 6-phosphate phosphatase
MSLDPDTLTIQIVRQILKGPPVYWIFDLDGTLVDLAPAPDAIVVPPPLLDDLDQLAQRFGGRVAMVSGRAAADLRSWIPLNSLTYIGNHGAECIQNGQSWTTPQDPAAQAALDRVRAAASPLQSHYPGSLLEDKGQTLSFHFRQVSPLLRAPLHASLSQLVADTPLLTLRPADECWEIRPVGAPTKGDAVLKLLEENPARPIIFGDDWTDEDAFAAAPPNSITVIVGARRPTQARFKLHSPRDVRALIAAVVHEA